MQRFVLGSYTAYTAQSVGTTGHILAGSSPDAVQQQMRVTEPEDDSHVEDNAELERQSPPFVMDGAVSSATVLELVHVNPDA